VGVTGRPKRTARMRRLKLRAVQADSAGDFFTGSSRIRAYKHSTSRFVSRFNAGRVIRTMLPDAHWYLAGDRNKAVTGTAKRKPGRKEADNGGVAGRPCDTG